MAAHVHRRGGGNGLVGFVAGALLVALLVLGWVAWSGGMISGPDPARVAMNLQIPEPSALPTPTPIPDPQPTPLPLPDPRPR